MNRQSVLNVIRKDEKQRVTDRLNKVNSKFYEAKQKSQKVYFKKPDELIMLEHIDIRSQNSIGMRQHKTNYQRKLDSLNNIENMERYIGQKAMSSDKQFKQPYNSLRNKNSNSMLSINFSQDLKNYVTEGNSLFKFNKRPLLNSKEEESIYYEEMFKSISKLNEYADEQTKKKLISQLKASIAELGDTQVDNKLKNIIELSKEQENSLILNKEPDHHPSNIVNSMIKNKENPSDLDTNFTTLPSKRNWVLRTKQTRNKNILVDNVSIGEEDGTTNQFDKNFNTECEEKAPKNQKYKQLCKSMNGFLKRSQEPNSSILNKKLFRLKSQKMITEGNEKSESNHGTNFVKTGYTISESENEKKKFYKSQNEFFKSANLSNGFIASQSSKKAVKLLQKINNSSGGKVANLGASRKLKKTENMTSRTAISDNKLRASLKVSNLTGLTEGLAVKILNTDPGTIKNQDGIIQTQKANYTGDIEFNQMPLGFSSARGWRGTRPKVQFEHYLKL